MRPKLRVGLQGGDEAVGAEGDDAGADPPDQPRCSRTPCQISQAPPISAIAASDEQRRQRHDRHKGDDRPPVSPDRAPLRPTSYPVDGVSSRVDGVRSRLVGRTSVGLVGRTVAWWSAWSRGGVRARPVGAQAASRVRGRLASARSPGGARTGPGPANAQLGRRGEDEVRGPTSRPPGARPPVRRRARAALAGPVHRAPDVAARLGTRHPDRCLGRPRRAKSTSGTAPPTCTGSAPTARGANRHPSPPTGRPSGGSPTPAATRRPGCCSRRGRRRHHRAPRRRGRLPRGLRRRARSRRRSMSTKHGRADLVRRGGVAD